jgi:putative Holliday junction resolvase
MRVLGVDPGTRRIGLAVSDALGITARPLYAIESKGYRADAAQVAEAADAQGAESIVVGLPLHMSGRESPAAKRARRLVQALRRATTLPVEIWDERLSTVEAAGIMIEAGVAREKRRDRIDAAAAAVILQSYLDRLSRSSQPSGEGR